MKNFKSIMLAAIAAMTCLTLPSCSDDDDGNPIGNEEDLIGIWAPTHLKGWTKIDGKNADSWDWSWEDEYGSTEQRLEIYADGSWAWKSLWSGSWHTDGRGVWEAESGSYVIELTNGYANFINGNSDEVKVVKLTGSTLQTEQHDFWDFEDESFEEKNWTTFNKITYQD